MQIKKTFNQTKFAPAHIKEAVRLLGDDVKIGYNTVSGNDETMSFDNLEAWISAYDDKCSEASINIEAKEEQLNIHYYLEKTAIQITSKDKDRMNTILSVFENSAKVSAIPEEPEISKGVDVELFCEVRPLHWQTLHLLPEHLSKLGLQTKKQLVVIKRYPMDVTYANWAPVLKDIQDNGEPKKFIICFESTYPQPNFRVHIVKDYFRDSKKQYLHITINNIPNIQMVDEITQFLGLKAAQPSPDSVKLERTAFIAHRFDELGEQVADRLARFLTLLGFDVKTGRGFSPKSVSSKVIERLKAQEITFVVLTPGTDATWLTQESILAFAEDKHVFVLRETTVEFKSGLLGDIEFIPFTSSKVESAFISILEGLKEIGFDLGTDKLT